MISNIQNYVTKIKTISKHDDNAIDRLNYSTTACILFAFSLLLFTKNYVGEPIQCWVPNQFPDAWETFTEQYCFIENTYFVPMNDSNLPVSNTREDREMIYYQWVPFILILLGLLMCIPRAFWSLWPSYSGLTISEVITSARKAGSELKNPENELDEAARQLQTPNLTANKLRGRLFTNYVVMKAMILSIDVLIFCVLNQFLNTRYTFWGWGILWDLVYHRHWHESGHFPRVSFCDVVVRELGNINNWTVQCVLMVNMFNEKIFIFLWFWFLMLIVITAFDLIRWAYFRMSKSSRAAFISELLDQHGIKTSSEGQNVLYEQVLRDDGVLFLRLLDTNCGRLYAEELIKKIWLLSNGEEASPFQSPVEQLSTDSAPRASSNE